ncbi:unnamed protein product (macronuclear) [Paramecium tetraurelia]|uniref:EF-hand domain-containing protein n=1 Tax=Paramecium tetraurelia TaxID=5888 RepID=A0BUX6_PARTE|nr:uncharacterized protein GSPATT00005589001 [Paramecium tetraurelia]CAK62343.1 unnamed protein product [Paramecium tetraurelia]|eukprot:XP_001429741.1 hypothetical protein (macronuclear) [Paramecium tetraurelia strain d4-2]
MKKPIKYYQISLNKASKDNVRAIKILETSQFLNSRQRTSQEMLQSIVSHQSSTNKFYVPFQSDFAKRKNNSLSSFEKVGSSSRIGNRRQQIQQTEQFFQSQITPSNRQEYLDKMEDFITEILTEEFKEISSLFTTFMKQYQLYIDDYQLQLSIKEKQLELENLTEFERMNSKYSKTSQQYENQIKSLNYNVEQYNIDIHKLKSEIQDQGRKYKELRQRFELKQREIDIKNKKIKSLECDIQSQQKKIQYYENKLQQTFGKDQMTDIKQSYQDTFQRKNSTSNLNIQTYSQQTPSNNLIPLRTSVKKVSIVSILNSPINQPPDLLKKKSTTQKSDSSIEQLEEEVEEQDKLNQIELNYDRIIEYRTSEAQVEYDLQEMYCKSIEVQTELTMIGQNYDSLKQENIENALKYTEFIKEVNNKGENQQDQNFDKMFDQLLKDAEDVNAQNGVQIVSNTQTQVQSSKRLSMYGTSKDSINLDDNSQLQQKNKQKKEQQIKQLYSFFNYSKSRLVELTDDNDQKKITIVSLQFQNENLSNQIKQLQEEIHKLKLQAIDDRILIQDLKTKQEHATVVQHTNAEQNLITSQPLSQQNEHKQQKQQQQPKKGVKNRIPQLGQKVTISYDFQKNQSKQLIDKIKTKNMTKFTNFLPLKAVLKYITTLYFDKIHNQKEQKQLKDQDMSAFIYNYYMQQFGYTKVTEQRFMILVLSIKKNVKLVRANVFAKFMGLFEENQNYSANEQQRYLEALEYVTNQQNLGITIKDNESESRYFIPYVRALSYLSQLQQYNFSQEEFNYLKSEFEELKENDPKGQNKLGIIDFDLMMIRVLQIFRNNVEKTKAYVINAFAASDLDGNGMCNIDEWLLLNRHIEGEKYDEDKLIDAFEENADLIVEEEKNLSFETFSILCMSLELFSDAAQNKFLKVRNNQDVLVRFQQVQTVWTEEYTKCLQKLSASEIEEQEKQKWGTILNVLNDKILSNPEQVKPLLIAHKIFIEEIK